MPPHWSAQICIYHRFASQFGLVNHAVVFHAAMRRFDLEEVRDDRRGRTSGDSRTICRRRSAAPEGFRRPLSQLIAVSRDTLSQRAKTPWLAFRSRRKRAISCGRMFSTFGGRGISLVLSVIFPRACSSASASPDFRFAKSLFFLFCIP